MLVIGGVGQGKLDYALKKTGLTMAHVGRDPGEGRPILSGLEAWVRTHPETTAEQLADGNPDVVILCDEVGCGVVPLDPEERAWRERVGRLCCRLAEHAQGVERIFCGLPMILKGDGVWK